VPVEENVPLTEGENRASNFCGIVDFGHAQLQSVLELQDSIREVWEKSEEMKVTVNCFVNICKKYE
jgi:hypothetical protein